MKTVAFLCTLAVAQAVGSSTLKFKDGSGTCTIQKLGSNLKISDGCDIQANTHTLASLAQAISEQGTKLDNLHTYVHNTAAPSISENADDIDDIEAGLNNSPLAHHSKGAHLCENGQLTAAVGAHEYTCVCDEGYTGGGAWQTGSHLYPACVLASCHAGSTGTAPSCGTCDATGYTGASTWDGSAWSACACATGFAGASCSVVSCDVGSAGTAPSCGTCDAAGYKGTSSWDGSSWSACAAIQCSDNNGGCHANADCTNGGSVPPTCACSDGYVGDGYDCTNECTATDVTSYSKAAFNSAFEASGLIKRVCNSCEDSHKIIVYKRTGSMPAGHDWHDLFMSNWFSTHNGMSNSLNSDFKLYDSVADAESNVGAWNACNYDDPGVGFPRDCGKTGLKGGQWNPSQSAQWFVITGACGPLESSPTGCVAADITSYSTADFNAAFEQAGMIKRTCSSCGSQHQTIVYRRLTYMPAGHNWADLFQENWFDLHQGMHNALNEDFKLYSSVSDAQNDVGSWSQCNYDDPGVGFPRDCGPSGLVGGQWNSNSKGGRSVQWQTVCY